MDDFLQEKQKLYQINDLQLLFPHASPNFLITLIKLSNCITKHQAKHQHDIDKKKKKPKSYHIYNLQLSSSPAHTLPSSM